MCGIAAIFSYRGGPPVAESELLSIRDRMTSRVPDGAGVWIWDDRRKSLFLARDPYGIKPLYYADDGKTFRAASQVKALLAGEGVDAAPNPAGHAGFFLWGHVPDPHTLYRGIRAVPAGSFIWVERGKDRSETNFCRVQRIFAGAATGKGRSSYQQAIREALQD